MQEIKLLIKVINSISDKSNIAVKVGRTKNLENRFLLGVIQDEFNSDADASKILYDSDKTDFRYKMLKHRVKKKLYDKLLITDSSKSRIVNQKEQECLKLLHISKLLLKQTEYDLVASNCNKIRSIASVFEFNDILLNVIELELICIANSGSYKLFNKKTKELIKYTNIVNLEREAINQFYSTKVHIKSNVKTRQEYLKNVPSILSRLKDIWDQTSTYLAFDSLYKTSILYYELIGNFKEIEEITDEAKDLVQQGLVNTHRFDKSFNAHMLIYAQLRIKKYAIGLEYADKFNSYFDPKTLNWFSYMENYFLLALHSKNYELARLLLHRVLNNAIFNSNLKDSKERWQLYKAYLDFMEPSAPVLESFNYQKFITYFTEYNKDKQGFNVAILILQFMYFLKKGDTEALLYRIESLKKYILTHLNDTFSLRSKLFLKLLMLTVTEDYDASSCRTKGAKHYQKLLETPTPGDAYAEIEIVPYEHLWELILDEMSK
ncbi:hypothetical protein [Pontibacter populi]|uniref:Uncharacterized protein n=1 Tax=Pontibacter populi TaxID=890055 RepID=A0ABV1RS18_9BACT